jgi:hypothetical protein
MWAAHETPLEAGGRTRIRWYQVGLELPGSPNILQAGTIGPGIPEAEWLFSPSIAGTEDGVACVTFVRTMVSQPLQIWTAVRLASDPAGTFRTPVLQASSLQPLLLSKIDYGCTVLDPAVALTFWFSHTTGAAALTFQQQAGCLLAQ